MFKDFSSKHASAEEKLKLELVETVLQYMRDHKIDFDELARRTNCPADYIRDQIDLDHDDSLARIIRIIPVLMTGLGMRYHMSWRRDEFLEYNWYAEKGRKVQDGSSSEGAKGEGVPDS